MRMITVTVSDEFHDWLAQTQGHAVALYGTDFAFDCVDVDQQGRLHCQGIFKAAAEGEGGPHIRNTILAQDEAFAKRIANKNFDVFVTGPFGQKTDCP